jgi:hypothetical protein
MWDNLAYSATWWFILPIVSLSVGWPVQIFSYRILKKFITSLVIGFVVGLLVMTSLSIWIISKFDLVLYDHISVFAANAIIYIFMQMWPISLFGVVGVALRVRILQFINTSQNASYHDLVTAFRPTELVNRRIERLVKTGQIKQIDGKYYLNKRFLLYIALILDAYKLFLLGKKSEFD